MKKRVGPYVRLKDGKLEHVDAYLRDLGMTRKELLDAMHPAASPTGKENRYAAIDRRNERDLTPGERAVLQAVQSRVGAEKLAKLKEQVATRSLKPDRRKAGYLKSRPQARSQSMGIGPSSLSDESIDRLIEKYESALAQHEAGQAPHPLGESPAKVRKYLKNALAERDRRRDTSGPLLRTHGIADTPQNRQTLKALIATHGESEAMRLLAELPDDPVDGLASTPIAETASPLDYHGVHPRRLQIGDTHFFGDEPGGYFEAPGTVAFLDYSPTSDGGAYVHYVATTMSHRNQGLARKLIDELYRRHPGMIDFGEIHHDALAKLYREKRADPELGKRTLGRDRTAMPDELRPKEAPADPVDGSTRFLAEAVRGRTDTPGLVTERRGNGWVVVHEGSGKPLSTREFATRGDARAVADALAGIADWTESAETLGAKADVASAAVEEFARHPDPWLAAYLRSQAKIQARNDPVDGSEAPDYRGLHRPDEDGPPAHDLLASDAEWSMPEDVYDHPEWYIGDARSQAGREAIAAIRQIRGKPDAPVLIYRAAPEGTGIQPGDWVTFSPTYARGHGMHSDDPTQDMPVHALRVRARDVRFAGDDLNEWGYFPEDPVDGITAEMRAASDDVVRALEAELAEVAGTPEEAQIAHELREAREALERADALDRAREADPVDGSPEPGGFFTPFHDGEDWWITTQDGEKVAKVGSKMEAEDGAERMNQRLVAVDVDEQEADDAANDAADDRWQEDQEDTPSVTSNDQWRAEAGNLTWEQARERFNDGRWSAVQWEAFAYLWVTRSPRFSDLARGYENPSREAKALADTLPDPRRGSR